MPVDHSEPMASPVMKRRSASCVKLAAKAVSPVKMA
jgi:hypothetical protein